jgi:Xaa-Pro aminopeptidase
VSLADSAAEIDRRVAVLQASMREHDLDGLVVYGNSKHAGSLRYLTGYSVDRTGWVSFGPTREEVFVFDGAGVVVPASGSPVLMIEPGHMVDVEIAVADWRGGGLTPAGGGGLSGPGVAQVLEPGSMKRIGIEPFDRIPAPLYLGIRDVFPGVELVPSTLVEEQRLIKSSFELDLMRHCGAIADAGHTAVVDALRSGEELSELDLVRIGDHAMRVLNPVYEDAAPPSTSKICTGTAVQGCMLHAPLADRRVTRGMAVNWDICGQYRGYSIDTSRTRVLGATTADQERAYAAALEMSRRVRAAMKPGAVTTDLVKLADDVGRDAGFGLWEMFLGHGIGMDCHERPDMGVEELILREDMVITVEPRISLDGFLYANEHMVHVTPDGGIALDQFPDGPLALD